MKEYRLLSTNPRSYTGKYDLPSNMPVQDLGLRPRSYTVAYWMVGRIFQYRTSGLCSIILTSASSNFQVGRGERYYMSSSQLDNLNLGLMVGQNLPRRILLSRSVMAEFSRQAPEAGGAKFVCGDCDMGFGRLHLLVSHIQVRRLYQTMQNLYQSMQNPKT